MWDQRMADLLRAPGPSASDVIAPTEASVGVDPQSLGRGWAAAASIAASPGPAAQRSRDIFEEDIETSATAGAPSPSPLSSDSDWARGSEDAAGSDADDSGASDRGGGSDGQDTLPGGPWTAGTAIAVPALAPVSLSSWDTTEAPVTGDNIVWVASPPRLSPRPWSGPGSIARTRSRPGTPGPAGPEIHRHWFGGRLAPPRMQPPVHRRDPVPPPNAGVPLNRPPTVSSTLDRRSSSAPLATVASTVPSTVATPSPTRGFLLKSKMSARTRTESTRSDDWRGKRAQHPRALSAPFAASVRAQLRTWIVLHARHPYPTADEKRHLLRQTGITLEQLNNWFINARRRVLVGHVRRRQAEEPDAPAFPQASSAGSATRYAASPSLRSATRR